MKKTNTSANTPNKSILNDIDRELSTREQMNRVESWEKEDDYVPATTEVHPLRIGVRKLRCEHFSGLLQESTGIDRDTGKEYTKPLRYEFVFIDVENNDRMKWTLRADDADAITRWKQNVNQRFGGACWRKFNEGVSKDAAAPVKAFKVGAFARYMHEHDVVIRYDYKEWVDRNGEYHASEKPCLYWYDPEKDNQERKWVF